MIHDKQHVLNFHNFHITNLYYSLLKRVDQSEENVIGVVTKIESILIKLETMDKSKIKRRETMSRLIDSIVNFMDHPAGGSQRFRSEASMYRGGSSRANAASRAAAASQASIRESTMSIKVYNLI